MVALIAAQWMKPHLHTIETPRPPITAGAEDGCARLIQATSCPLPPARALLFSRFESRRWKVEGQANDAEQGLS